MLGNIQEKIQKKIRQSIQQKKRNMLLSTTPVLLVLFAVFICGCDMSFGRKKPEVIEPPLLQPETPTVDDNATAGAAVAPDVQPATKRVLVKVDGQPLYMQPLYNALVDDYGLPLTKQFIADELVRQELVRQGISTEVTKNQIAAESKRALRLILGEIVDNPTPNQLDRLLAQFLAKQNYTLRHWNITMRRNVGLARLALRQAKVSDEELWEEFLRRYNGKLLSRHIQVPTLGEAEKILDKLKDGQDFAKLALKYSTNPSAKRGAWLPEIGTQTTEANMNPVLVQVVRSLEKTGDYSGAVQVGTNFHIIKLEKIIPPKNVKFEDISDELRAIVLLEKTQMLQQKILQELFQKAKIEYVAPSIREKFEQGKK